MSYCTSQNLVDAYGENELIQITDRSAQNSMDYAVLDAAIARAEARINRYLTAYLPLATTPADFVQIACDITRYFLYNDQPTPFVQKNYDDAIAYLEKVAAGKIPLGPDITGAQDAPTDGVAFTSASTVFSATELANF
jgi:phage gp36-like protein